MTAIKKILNQDNEQILPVTSTSAVIDSNGTTLESRLQYLEGGETDPFKGWYATTALLQSAHPSPKVGDYAYIPDASPATTASIYECTTAGTWSDSGRDVDTSNVQTFQTGEQVNATKVVNDLTTGGANDVASAETVKDIAELVEINNDYSIVSYEVKKTLYVSSGGVITTAGSSAYYIGYIPSVNIDRKIHIIVSDKSSSTGNYAQPVRGVFFVEDVSEIVNGTTVTYLIEPSKTMQVSLDVEINVPANKILCVTYFKDGYAYQELATYEDIGNPSSKIKEAIGDISGLLGIEYTKGEELQHTAYNVYLKSNNVINSISGSGKTYAYAASNEDRKLYVKQYFNTTYLTPYAAAFLIDSTSELVADTFISYSNILIVPRSNISGIVNDTIISVPAGKILCVTTVENPDDYCKVCEAILQSNEIESLNTKIGDLQDLETTINTSVVASINEVAESVYANITSPLSPTKILGRRLNDNTTIKSATEGTWNIAYFAARQEEWKANIVANNISSSIAVGAVVLVDAVTDLDIDDTVSPIINSHPANSGGTPWSMDVVVKVPAGKILAVFEINYYSIVFNYNEVTGKAVKTDLLEQEQERLAAIVSNPDYVSENPLDIIKETAGYTAIFRTMGVIGGSMSSGSHPSNVGSDDLDPSEYAYSSLQFMARLCGAEGFNFSVGGMSAHAWPTNGSIGGTSDLFNNNPCQMYLIQLGNNDVSYVNPDSTVYDSTYSMGNVSDVAGNNGMYANTFYGKMGEILQAIRRVQPRAYVFLSTFLKGYGTIPPSYAPDFDYNVAIRNIVQYYTENDGANRPEGDELHYYLIDYYTYGKPYSYYYNGIHTGTTRGSHLVATGYLLWAYQYCTYIDWIIKNNMADFNDVAFVGSDRYYNG